MPRGSGQNAGIGREMSPVLALIQGEVLGKGRMGSMILGSWNGVSREECKGKTPTARSGHG